MLLNQCVYKSQGFLGHKNEEEDEDRTCRITRKEGTVLVQNDYRDDGWRDFSSGRFSVDGMKDEEVLSLYS